MNRYASKALDQEVTVVPAEDSGVAIRAVSDHGSFKIHVSGRLRVEVAVLSLTDHATKGYLLAR